MTITTDQLKVLSFGYLTGNDLLQWCNTQLLIKQYEVDSTSLQRGHDQALSEIISSLSNRYDLTAELAKKGNVPATAIAIIAAGALSGINPLVPGTNYTTVPTVQIIGGGGSGAAATAVITNQAVSSFNVTAPGINYTTAPQINIVGGQPADTRSILLVKIMANLAVRNVVGNVENISDKLNDNWKWADNNVMNIRKGQSNLPINAAGSVIASVGELISDITNNIG